MNHSGTSYGSMSPSITSYKAGILYADRESHRILLWRKNSAEVEVFAESGIQGNKDGIASRTEFYQPTGLCVEFDHVAYVCDAQPNCINILTSLKQTATLFNALGKIYEAFLVHEKHQYGSDLVSGTLRVLRSNENSIRDEVANLPRSLNGPQGNVA